MKSLMMLAFSAFLLVLGGLCINYTKPSTLGEHRRWASEKSAPAPSDAVLAGGIICVVAGLGLPARKLWRG